MADIAASVLAKLKNKAKASGISYQQCLQLFMQEEFLRKLSKSGYDNFLVLKGGLFLSYNLSTDAMILSLRRNLLKSFCSHIDIVVARGSVNNFAN